MPGSAGRRIKEKRENLQIKKDRETEGQENRKTRKQETPGNRKRGKDEKRGCH